MQALREAHPFYNSYYKNISKAEQTGEHEVTFMFSETGNRELPLITGQMPVLPKHWWTGKDAKGGSANSRRRRWKFRWVPAPMWPPRSSPGASIGMRRVEDYWGRDLPVNVGQDNFDEMEYIYFRDANVALEAFNGDQYDCRLENTSKNWATGYDFPAIKDGRVIKEEITLKQVEGMQSLGHQHPRARSSRTCASARP